MSTPTTTTAFAVLRVDRRKAKAMGAIAAASAHTMRERHTPNADPQGVAPIVMHLAHGSTPYQAASRLLDGVERRNKDTVLCREIVLSASPSYFRPGRERVGGVYDPHRVKAWAIASVAWAKREWPDQIASAVLHLDEMTPHLHLLVVPRVMSAAGTWKLNSKSLFDRERLRAMQSTYAEALAPLGIQRGEPGSKAVHKDVQKLYGSIQSATALPQQVTPPQPPRRPRPPATLQHRLVEGLASFAGFETEYQRALQQHGKAMAAWRARIQEVKDQNAQSWDTMRMMATAKPLQGRRQEAVQPAPPPIVAPRPSTPSARP